MATMMMMNMTIPSDGNGKGRGGGYGPGGSDAHRPWPVLGHVTTFDWRCDELSVCRRVLVKSRPMRCSCRWRGRRQCLGKAMPVGHVQVRCKCGSS